MATETIRPDGNVTTTWTYTCSYSYIDNVVNQPSDGGDADWTMGDQTDSNEVFEVTLGNPSVVTSGIGKLTLWMREWIYELGDYPPTVDYPEIKLYCNGGYTSVKTSTANRYPGTFGWESYTWSDLSIDDADDCRLWVKLGTHTGNPLKDTALYYLVVAYVILDTTGYVPTGGPAGIDEISGLGYGTRDEKMGIAWTDIEEIFGV